MSTGHSAPELLLLDLYKIIAQHPQSLTLLG